MKLHHSENMCYVIETIGFQKYRKLYLKGNIPFILLIFFGEREL